MTTHVYNFKPQFIAPIRGGMKVHTIRAARKDGRVPKPGDKLKLFSGLRQKGPATLILETVCVSVTPITLLVSNKGYLRVRLDGVELVDTRKVTLAFNDGFLSFSGFKDYFLGTDLPLVGHLIAWKKVTY